MNKKALGLAGLGAVALVGGSLAYYTANSSVENPFTTGEHSTDLYERYNPPTDEMIPGAEWDKDVSATNTGDYPVLVRIRMDEEWRRDGAVYKALSSTADNNKDYFLANEWNDTDKVGYDEKTGKFIAKQEDVTGKFTEAGDIDGLVPENPNGRNVGDATIVHKKLVNVETRQDNPDWYYNEADGYWYWNRVLMPEGEAGDTTDLLMDGLVLASNMDLGKYDTKEYFCLVKNNPNATKDDIAEENWREIKITDMGITGDGITGTIEDRNEDGEIDIIDLSIALDVTENDTLLRKSESALNEDLPGYANSNYALNVTAEFVQATKDAVVAEWGDGIVTDKTVGDTTTPAILSKIGTDGDAVLVNK